ncbi:hypothetical protein M8044_000081, partial [Columbia Basin potato purple top phytoplasma]|nr:hypothetical protein [Columbia Basin potato purple top phytoplasma]
RTKKRNYHKFLFLLNYLIFEYIKNFKFLIKNKRNLKFIFYTTAKT